MAKLTGVSDSSNESVPTFVRCPHGGVESDRGLPFRHDVEQIPGSIGAKTRPKTLRELAEIGRCLIESKNLERLIL